MLIYGLSMASYAQVPEVGVTELVRDYVSPPFPEEPASVVNASIVAAEGDLWIAAEWHEIGTDDTHLDLWWFNGTNWARKTMTTTPLDSNFALGDIQAMYPTITVWAGSPYVYLTGKQNQTPSGTEPHLVSFRQDRDNLSAAASQSDLATTIGADIRHGRPHLFNDFEIEVDGALLLCWTRRDVSQSPDDDDLQRKGKDDVVGWPASTLQTLAAHSTAEDDHCQQGVDLEGTIWTSFHSDSSGNDRIYVNHAFYNPVTDTWNNQGSDLPDWGASGWSNADFPSLSVGGDLSSDVRMIVAQRVANPSDEIAWWRCEGDTTDCNLGTDWWGGEYNPSGVSNNMSQPMVIVDRVFGHAFTFFELVGGNIGIAKWCDGDTSWSDVGVVDILGSHNNTLDHEWGEFAGSPLPVLAIDYYEYELHAVFLAVPDGSTDTRNDLMHWSLPVDDSALCP